MLNSFTLMNEGRELRLVFNSETRKMRWFLDGQLISVYADVASAGYYPWPFSVAVADTAALSATGNSAADNIVTSPIGRETSGAQLLIDWAYADQTALIQIEAQGQVMEQFILALTPLTPFELETLNSARLASHGQKAAPSFSWLNAGLVGLKLFKSATVFKAALAAASLGVYTLMMSFEFALALLGILVFHEYGHLVAMKRAGIPTKGMYLIPFVGGLAVGGKPSSRWQEVYISMMGPVFGLAMTLVFALIYALTDNQFAGLVASMSALLNLFNLIPVNPLDGGQVVKALLFSSQRKAALWVAMVISALCFVLSIKFGVYLLSFFIVIGVIDLVFSWRNRLIEDLVPLNRYGIVFSLVWYLLTVAAFVAIILVLSQTLIGGEIAKAVLSS